MPREIVDGLIHCRKCGVDKNPDDFYAVTSSSTGKASACKLCDQARRRAWDVANPERAAATKVRSRKRRKEYHRANQLQKKYGITRAEYHLLLQIQGGGCAICGVKSNASGREHSVDHDHRTGQVRGVLCTLCNRGLGVFKDSWVTLLKASEYLKKFTWTDPT